MKTKKEIITAMCYTYRHDFGLDKDPSSISSGVTPREREAIYNMMKQIFENDIEPWVELKQ